MPEEAVPPPLLAGSEGEPLAGLSSVKMADTSEPAFDRKKKQLDHERNVTFLTDHAEHIPSKPNDDDKAMRYRAGFRQTYPTLPTSYQWHYTWKTPLFLPSSTEEEKEEPTTLTTTAPLHRHKHPHHTSKSNREGGKPPAAYRPPVKDVSKPVSLPATVEGLSKPVSLTRPVDELRASVGFTSGGRREKGEEESRGRASEENGGRVISRKKVTMEIQASDVGNAVEKPSKPPEQLTKQIRESVSYPQPLKPPAKVRGQTQVKKAALPPSKGADLIQALLDSKAKAAKSHKSRRKEKKKHSDEARMPNFFVSTYTENYKAWSNPPTPKENEVVAGSPKKLTDPSDPRLLKHCPLPVISMFYPSSSLWGSEYNSNFMPPSEFKFPPGAFSAAPQHETTTDAATANSKVQMSWFDQLLELRQEAQFYKQRSEETQFSPHHLFLLGQDQLHLLERASGSSLPTSSASALSSISSSSAAHGSESGDSKASEVNSEGSCVNSEGLVVEDIETESSRQRQITTTTATAGVARRQGTAPSAKPVPATGSTAPKPVPKTSLAANTVASDGDRLGRIPTPVLQTAPPPEVHRHHLDLTTPSEGGLLTSPVKLPFPPPSSSAKYRRDMISKAPIFPSPKPSRYHSDPTSRVPHAAHSDSRVPGLGGKPAPQSVHIHIEDENDDLPKRRKNTQSQTEEDEEFEPSVPFSSTSGQHGSYIRRETASARQSQKPPSSPSSSVHRKLQFAAAGSTSTHQHRQPLSCCLKQPLFVRECNTCGARLRSPKKPTNSSYLSRGGVDRASGFKTAPTTSSFKPRAPTTKLPIPSYSTRVPARVPARSSPTNGYPLQPGNAEEEVEDDDNISLASLSLSSCSVASDLLQRAQERSHFWNSRNEAVEA